MDAAYRACGNVIVKMIAEMGRTRAIFVPRKPVPISNSRVRALAIASRAPGCVMVTMTVSISKTKRIARQFPVRRTNLNAPICGSAWKNRTNVTEFRTATMAAMSWDAHLWDRTNAIKRNTFAVNLPAFVYRLHGIVMAQTIATIILTKRIVAKYHAPPISTSATTRIAYLKRIFAMAKMIAATIRTRVRFTPVYRRHLNVRPVNGFALVLRNVVSICHRCAITCPTVQTALMRERIAT